MDVLSPLPNSATADNVAAEDRESKRSKVGISRQFVESIHLSTLLASYNQHFAKYSEGRKNVSQLIPGAVWRLVYKDFCGAYPNAQFSEETLKKKVSEELKSAKTGTSNNGDNKAVLQSESVLEQLKLTPGHAKRNVLKHRAAIIAGESGNLVPKSSEERPEIVSPKTPKTSCAEKGGTFKTKSQMLSVQSSSIQKISIEIGELRKEKTSLNKEKLLKAKLENFEKLLQLGLITKEEMQADLKVFLQTQ